MAVGERVAQRPAGGFVAGLVDRAPRHRRHAVIGEEFHRAGEIPGGEAVVKRLRHGLSFTRELLLS
jgi:hypothetical protein